MEARQERSVFRDIFGIGLMLVPCLISIFFNRVIPFKLIGIVRIASRDRVINIQPGLVSMACAVAFYGALMARFEGIFDLSHGAYRSAVSILRFLINCWAISAVISIAIPSHVPRNATWMGILAANPGLLGIALALLMSWLGMKTVAGYSWLLFILASVRRLIEINGAMKMWGALFALTFGLSLFVQVRDFVVIRDLIRDFRGSFGASGIREEITGAIDDAVKKAHSAAGYVRTGPSRVPDEDHPGAEAGSGEIRINLEALDVNRDGVVDDRDFGLLSRGDDRGE